MENRSHLKTRADTARQPLATGDKTDKRDVRLNYKRNAVGYRIVQFCIPNSSCLHLPIVDTRCLHTLDKKKELREDADKKRGSGKQTRKIGIMVDRCSHQELKISKQTVNLRFKNENNLKISYTPNKIIRLKKKVEPNIPQYNQEMIDKYRKLLMKRSESHPKMRELNKLKNVEINNRISRNVVNEHKNLRSSSVKPKQYI